MRRGPGLAVAATAVVVAALTLGPLPVGGLDAFHALLTELGRRAGVSVTRIHAEAVANVLLFVPVGAGMALLRPRWPVALVTGLAVLVSMGLELVQATLPGRTSSLRDVLLNATGALLGALAAAAWRRR